MPPLLAAVAAAAAPSLLAYNVSPSPTFLNQALALALWATFVLACAPRATGGAARPLAAVLAALALGVLWSWGPGALPATFGLSALGLLAAAGVLAVAGAAAVGEPARENAFAAFATGWVAAGVLNVAVACLQVFAPDLPDGEWISASTMPGRAVGNLRQPNHLSSLLLWSAIAAVALLEMGQLARRAAAVLLGLFIFGVVLTASRTGVVSVLLLALWGLADRRLTRPGRLLLLAAPFLYALAWAGMAQWAEWSHGSFGGTQRLAEGGDISSSRFAIWSNTLTLIAREPWRGVGFGEFNLAWSLTPFPGRPTAFFDHTHNLPLQLLVELGVPLGGLVIGLLLWALWRALRSAGQTGGAAGAAARAAMMMVLMIGLHSLLEYPLWYAYFLLPAAWAWGFALGPAAASPSPAAAAVPAVQPPAAAGRAAGLLTWAALAVVVGASLSVVDYLRVAAIFRAGEGLPPLQQRIEAGQRSWLFAHHADYAAVTSSVPAHDMRAAFGRTAHYLLDTRLMMAWAVWLAEQGELDRARHLAERLREFKKQEVEEFFDPCPEAPRTDPGAPFQCQAPARTPGWREYLVQ